MGNLHEGHLDLVRKARQLCDVVVVSIFVNPLQFGPNEDLDAYPRTLAADKEKLFSEGVQVLVRTRREGNLSRGHAGPDPGACTGPGRHALRQQPPRSFRRCHHGGQQTVQHRTTRCRVFGEKDFQQLSIVRKMVEDLCMPIEIVGVATTRDEDGLAKSSRNGYLSFEQRRIAPVLHQTLNSCREAIACGFDNFLQLESHARMQLLQAGFEPDYFAIRDARTLRPSPKTPRKLPSWPRPGWAPPV